MSEKDMLQMIGELNTYNLIRHYQIRDLTIEKHRIIHELNGVKIGLSQVCTNYIDQKRAYDSLRLECNRIDDEKKILHHELLKQKSINKRTR